MYYLRCIHETIFDTHDFLKVVVTWTRAILVSPTLHVKQRSWLILTWTWLRVMTCSSDHRPIHWVSESWFKLITRSLKHCSLKNQEFIWGPLNLKLWRIAKLNVNLYPQVSGEQVVAKTNRSNKCVCVCYSTQACQKIRLYTRIR